MMEILKELDNEITVDVHQRLKLGLRTRITKKNIEVGKIVK